MENTNELLVKAQIAELRRENKRIKDCIKVFLLAVKKGSILLFDNDDSNRVDWLKYLECFSEDLPPR